MNPSFEEYDSCPNLMGQLIRAKYWFNPTQNTPDYFNSCAIGLGLDSVCDVPKNLVGFQNARTGQGYAGFAGYYISPNGRDYIGGHLSDSLQQGAKYLVTFFVSLGNSKYAIDNIGAYFSTDSIHLPIMTNLAFTPQIRSMPGVFLDDTLNWVEISDTLLAGGGEKFLTIGTFATDSELVIDTVNTGIAWYSAYYYIDDISVVELPTGIGGEKHRKPFEAKVFPNPANGDVQIIYSDARLNSCSFKLMNLLGKTVLLQEIEKQSGTLTLNTSNLPAGIYFYEIDVHDLTSSKGKFVIVH